MAKHRTRKQKELAKHTFTISWKPEAKKTDSEPSVKRQIETNKKIKKGNDLRIKHSDYSDQIVNLASIKKDITKSLILAVIILASEVVLYLLWRKT